eukprot:44444-Heterocapsa_arctica.AAC.1
MRKQLAAYWCFCSDMTVDQTVALADMSWNKVYDLYHRFVSIVAPYQETLDDALRVGGEGEEVEADEVAFW